MTPRPYGARVVVTDPPAQPQEGLASGLIVPSGAYDKVNRGLVVYVGDDVPHLSPGDVVYYLHDHALELGDYKLINRECILAWEGEV